MSDSSADRGTDAPVSPLGRYGGSTEASADLVTVRLLAAPLQLLAAGREWHDSVLAELRSRALNPTSVPAGTPPRLEELTQVLGVRYGSAAPRPDAEVDAALDAGRLQLDLTYRVPPDAAPAARALADLLDEVDGFCELGLLLTGPRPAELRVFAAWWSEQVSSQCAGAQPRAWDGPLDLPPAAT